MIQTHFKYINIILIILIIILINNSLYLSDLTNSSRNNDNYTRSLQPGGWSRDTRISEKNNDYWCIGTNVASSNSYVHVLWIANRNSTDAHKDLCYRRSIDGGNTWDDIVQLKDEEVI